MKRLLIAGLTLVIQQTIHAKCVPAKIVVDYPADLPNVGMYHRVHPSGKYVIASAADDSGKVSIIDLTGKDEKGNIVAKSIPTPMINEAYPVEGNWSLVASPLHDDGMRYYNFKDVLKEQAETSAVFNDKEHNNWYHSSAELPGSKPNEFKFRTMLYGESYRDYKVSYDAKGKLTKEEHTETKRACRNLTTSLTAPILSKDGTEVASNVTGQTTIYKIKDDSTCEVVDEVGYNTSKVNFSYPVSGKKGQIVFAGDAVLMVDGRPTYVNGVFLYDRDKKLTKRLTAADENAGVYPGMTKDGRVVYFLARDKKIVIADPSQLDETGKILENPSTCIQEKGGSSKKAKAKKSTASKQ